jgi:hypothetical protein
MIFDRFCYIFLVTFNFLLDLSDHYRVISVSDLLIAFLQFDTIVIKSIEDVIIEKQSTNLL